MEISSSVQEPSYRYHYSDSEPEHDDLDSVVMVDKTDHQIKVQHLKRVKGKQVRLGSTGPAAFGIHLGIKNPEPECILPDNRWFYGDTALINKKHSPKFSLYDEPYFPAIVVGSHKGNLVLVGKCSDDKPDTYTGELLTVPGSVAIHVMNFCIGHASCYSFFGNPDGLQNMIAFRVSSGSSHFELRTGDLCGMPIKAKGARQVSTLTTLIVGFLKTHEWKVVGIVLPTFGMENWCEDALEAHIGQAGAVTFLDKFRNEENGYLVWPEPTKPAEVSEKLARITITAIEVLLKHARTGTSDPFKSIVQLTASSVKHEEHLKQQIIPDISQYEMTLWREHLGGGCLK